MTGPARAVAAGVLSAMLAGCAPAEPERGAEPAPGAPPQAWAIGIHGGAGTIDRDMGAEVRDDYLGALREALATGRDRLDGGSSALDVVEEVIRRLEDDPRFNAGRGAVFTWDGGHELDASIMDGETLACGAVAGVATVRHPITLARLVMERSPHVLLAGPGAERFADEHGLERVATGWFDTERRREAWRRFRAEAQGGEPHGTVGVVALDRNGRLAAGTSTGGTTGKRWGRIGDSPIVGAGTWADDATCAVSATGKGEEFIRHAVARSIAARVELSGSNCAAAARFVIEETLSPGDGGVVVLDAAGRVSFAFNTTGMYRAAADADGRFEVAIWD